MFSDSEVREVDDRTTFGRRSGVSSMFWTSVFQVDFVENIISKKRITRLKKLPTVTVGHIFH